MMRVLSFWGQVDFFERFKVAFRFAQRTLRERERKDFIARQSGMISFAPIRPWRKRLPVPAAAAIFSGCGRNETRMRRRQADKLGFTPFQCSEKIGGDFTDTHQTFLLLKVFFLAESHEGLLFHALDMFQHEAIEFLPNFFDAERTHTPP